MNNMPKNLLQKVLNLVLFSGETLTLHPSSTLQKMMTFILMLDLRQKEDKFSATRSGCSGALSKFFKDPPHKWPYRNNSETSCYGQIGGGLAYSVL